MTVQTENLEDENKRDYEESDYDADDEGSDDGEVPCTKGIGKGTLSNTLRGGRVGVNMKFKEGLKGKKVLEHHQTVERPRKGTPG